MFVHIHHSDRLRGGRLHGLRNGAAFLKLRMYRDGFVAPEPDAAVNKPCPARETPLSTPTFGRTRPLDRRRQLSILEETARA